MPIKIPSKVRILSRHYDVEWVNNLVSDKSSQGEIAYREQKIRLQPSLEGAPRHHEAIETSFFHEIIHGALYELNYMTLKDDEDLVDRLANVLYGTLRDANMLVTED